MRDRESSMCAGHILLRVLCVWRGRLIHEDRVGVEFAEALMEKARSGVRVRLIWD
jgi:phosphatidylserine/phosphatidylglycerophosphate/cardiolipin synthase-like enzyme